MKQSSFDGSMKLSLSFSKPSVIGRGHLLQRMKPMYSPNVENENPCIRWIFKQICAAHSCRVCKMKLCIFIKYGKERFFNPRWSVYFLNTVFACTVINHFLKEMDNFRSSTWKRISFWSKSLIKQFSSVPDTASYIRGWIQMVLAPNDLFSWNNKYSKYTNIYIANTFTFIF